jgi:hypothetical protein
MLRLLAGSAIILSAITAISAAHAEEAPTFADRTEREVVGEDRTFALLVNPLAAAVGVYGGEADFVLGRHFAASVEGAVANAGDSLGLAVGGGLLFYPGTTFHGLYLEPRMVYVRPLTEKVTRFDLGTDVLGVGATAGWQWTWDYGFTVRLGVGGMYFAGGGSSGELGLSGPELVMDGSVGWAF